MYKDDILYYEDGEVIFKEDSIGKESYLTRGQFEEKG